MKKLMNEGRKGGVHPEEKKKCDYILYRRKRVKTLMSDEVI